MKQIRVVVSSKHPDGKIWILGQGGWAELSCSVGTLGGVFVKNVHRIDAELTVDDEIVEFLILESETAPEPVVLPDSECCTGD